MKKNVLCVTFLSFILCLTACVNKEKKAFEEACLSKETAKMKAFVKNYPEANPALIDSAKVLITEWESDSADYVYICQEKDLLERFDAEERYIYNHPEGINITKVMKIHEEDAVEAEALMAKLEAMGEKIEIFDEGFKNRVFYSDPKNGIIFSSPDADGKGQGVMFEINLLPTFYDFHYSINFDDQEDNEIMCKMDKYSGSFTVTLYDKTVYLHAKGDVNSYRGEIDEEAYKNFMERIANINNGKEVYGNPTTTIKIY